MSPAAPTLLWVRRAFRLDDAPALATAVEAGGPIIPVVLNDALVGALPPAPAFRLEKAIEAFAALLQSKGSRLVLRSGEALPALLRLAEETGARQVVWDRGYAPGEVARDKAVKAGLQARG